MSHVALSQAQPYVGRPLHTMFVITSMPVGGAETLLVNLVRRFDPWRVIPEVCCLKELGPLGEVLQREMPIHSGLWRHKLDVTIVQRLRRLLERRAIDAVVTVGAGDKMFWGRIAAHLAGVPVVLSALHSTGWPDCIGRLNRMLTGWTDQFIAVAQPHGQYLVEREGFPATKVAVIPNGVDTDRFQPDQSARESIRAELSIASDVPLVGIIAALRPEKDHRLFVHAAQKILAKIPTAHFLVVGDGPCRATIEKAIADAGIAASVHMLGVRHDVPRILAALDVFVLSSQQEANPVSVLEALAVGIPVVATRVGSLAQTVRDGLTGYLVAPGNAGEMALRCTYLIEHDLARHQMGMQGRHDVAANWSLDNMVRGYERLIHQVYAGKPSVWDHDRMASIAPVVTSVPVKKEQAATPPA